MGLNVPTPVILQIKIIVVISALSKIVIFEIERINWATEYERRSSVSTKN